MMNNIPKGYKQTEVGVIPDDWEVKTISGISNPVRGGSPRPAGDPKYFNGDFIPWLTVASLTNIPLSQIYVFETESYLTEEGSFHSRTLNKDTIIIANSGATLGIAKLLSMKCCANDGIAALFDFDKSINKTYLVYFINTKIRYLREVIATGNGQPNLNTDLIGKIKVPLPPTIEEQKAIANALSDIDTLINNIEKLINKKRNIKHGAMQKLLQPKEGWEVKKLGDFNFDISDGNYSSKYPSSSEFKENGVPFIRANNIKMMTIIDVDMRYISQELHAELVKGHLKKDDILITTRGEIGQIAIVPNHFIDSNINAQIVRINTNDKINNLFFAYFLQKSDSQKILLNLQTGSALKQLPVGKMKEIEIVYPNMEEQTHISTILSDIDAEITTLETKLEKYKNIKLGMMQNLLTGKIRLSEL